MNAPDSSAVCSDFDASMACESLLLVVVVMSLRLKWGMLQLAKEFCVLVILACCIVCLARCGPCATDGESKLVDYVASDRSKENCDTSFKDIFSGGFSLNYVPEPLETLASADDVCRSSDLFCFPSMLRGIKSEENNPRAARTGYAASSDVHREKGSNSSWSSDYGVFQFLNGQTVSCSGEVSYDISVSKRNHGYEGSLTSCTDYIACEQGTKVPSDKSFEIEATQPVDASSPNLLISPSQLDWGESYLYQPSHAFLTLKNTCNESELYIHEPFSSDAQFFPCNSTEFVLGPGEVGSLCFVFLPRSLGLSSSEIILQTSLGGFLLQARGYSLDSPYQAAPLELDVFPNGWRTSNFSLFNPFEESIQVEEIAMWASVFVGNDSLLAVAMCSENSSYDSAETDMYGSRRMLDVKNAGVDSRVTVVRPFGSWSIGQLRTESVVGISLSPHLEGKVSGALCIRLRRSLENKTDILVVPVDAEMSSRMPYSNAGGSVYASAEARHVYDTGDATAVVSIAMRNDASYMVKIVGISEVSEKGNLLQIKYSEGLLLFPGTTTQVALITYTTEDAGSDPLVTYRNCKLEVLTNDSSSGLIVIPCWDIVHIFPRYMWESSLGYEEQPRKVDTESSKEEPLSRGKEQPDLPQALKNSEADEIVLLNWRSHSTPSDLSVLDDHEVVFSKVPVGQHHSKLITVMNPSQQPVVMQLILNSGEIVHDCQAAHGYLQPPSSSSFLRSDLPPPPRYGFSVAAGALTEAFVHPFGKASLGPILFHPSSRCNWKSSALIRNNLSGVEWVTLHGSGGLLSLVLLKDSDPVHRLDFNLDVLLPLNFSSTSFKLNPQGAHHGCLKPLLKALQVINSGDLPVTVRKICISGTECGFDGFLVRNCSGFTVGPREAKELVISYQTDLAAAMVQRDLELSLDTGILVIPMKAIMPLDAFHLCQQAIFWFWLKKCRSVMAVVFFLICFILCLLAPHRVLCSLGCLIRGQKSAANIKNTGKSPKGIKGRSSSMSTEVDYLSRSVGKDEESLMRTVVYCSTGKCTASNVDSSVEHPNSFVDSRSKTITESVSRKEVVFPFHQPIKMQTIESSVAEAAQSNIQELGPLEPVQLTVKIGTEKRRKRRKRRGFGAGLAGLPEVSSSQSGNSTPSSPVSPMPAFTPKRTSPQQPEKEEPIKSWTPFSFASIVPSRDSDDDYSNPSLETPSALGKTFRRPVLLPSVTFPGMGRSVPGMPCPSPSQSPGLLVSPHSRAPGSKLLNQKSARAEEVSEDKFTYNIWGNHFSGLHLNFKSDEAIITGSVASENGSNSFFVRGPQTVVTNSPKPVSYVHQGG